MSAPLRLAAFTAALVLAFAAAWWLGAAVEPDVDSATPSTHGGM